MKKVILRKWDVAAYTYDELLEAMDEWRSLGAQGEVKGYAIHKSLSAAK